MARSVEQFRDMMLALLPRGPAWPTSKDSQLAQWLMGMAEEFARVDAKNEQLRMEMNPAKTVDLLPEWERDYGLPTQCMAGIAQTFTQRRNNLVEKYKLVGNQSKPFFIALAAAIGYTITITEYDENNPGPQSNYNGIPLSGDAWNFVWQVNASNTTITPRSYGSAYGEGYSSWGNELLECTMRYFSHGHRVLFFSYT